MGMVENIYGYRTDKIFTQKNEVSDAIRHDMFPFLKYLAIVVHY